MQAFRRQENHKVLAPIRKGIVVFGDPPRTHEHNLFGRFLLPFHLFFTPVFLCLFFFFFFLFFLCVTLWLFAVLVALVFMFCPVQCLIVVFGGSVLYPGILGKAPGQNLEKYRHTKIRNTISPEKCQDDEVLLIIAL